MSIRKRFFVELGLAGAFALFFIVTSIWSEWIELVFGVDPDNGDGTLEWSILALLALVTAIFLGLARTEWRRVRFRNEAINVRRDKGAARN